MLFNILECFSTFQTYSCEVIFGQIGVINWLDFEWYGFVKCSNRERVSYFFNVRFHFKVCVFYGFGFKGFCQMLLKMRQVNVVGKSPVRACLILSWKLDHDSWHFISNFFTQSELIEPFTPMTAQLGIRFFPLLSQHTVGYAPPWETWLRTLHW